MNALSPAFRTSTYYESSLFPQLQENHDSLQRAFFQQDGATPHFAQIVEVFLNQTLPHRWMSQGGSMKWAAHSSHLTPLDVFFFYL